LKLAIICYETSKRILSGGKSMRYGSVCSGIEAATAAWHHMGWEAAFFSEIEKFPCAVLQHRYPDVPLHGDFTTIKENEYGTIDLLVGGTPCQSFSIAGMRGGLDDDRGNLALEFCRLAQREKPRWIVWENVPGVLSSSGGRDFGSILGALEDIGYGLAYRVLDAQYFGVAQRRRRVFVVGYLGDWRPAAAVLFERHSMSGHPAPSREKRQEATDTAATGTGDSGCLGRERPDLAGPLTAGMHKGPRGTEAVESGHVIASTFNEDGTARTLTARYDGSPCVDRGPDVVGTLRAHHPGTAGVQSDTDHIVAVDTSGGGSQLEWPAEIAPTLNAAFSDKQGLENQHINGGAGWFVPTLAFTARDYGADATENLAPTMRSLTKGADGHQSGSHGLAVAYPINTQLGLRGPDVSNTSRDGFGVGDEADPAYTLQANHSHAVAFDWKMGEKARSIAINEEQSPTLGTQADRYAVLTSEPAIYQDSEFGVQAYDQAGTLRAGRIPAHQMTLQQSTVRRLTPVECERLQGFPDNFTAIPWRKKGAEDCPDGPRYKALGNSMAVPVMRWIGERIQMIEDMKK
jgi:DNA (cytosine-5)-methyltransferase 1